MAEDAWQPLAKLISKGDVAGVVAAIEALDEPARKRLSTQARRAAKEAGSGRAAGRAHGRSSGRAARSPAREWWWLNAQEELRERLVRCRPRDWRQEWAERICSDAEAVRWGQWRTVHQLVVDGSIDRPAAQGYVTGAVDALPETQTHGGPPRPLAEVLRSEPGWLQHDLWELFAIEESGLTARDSWGGRRPGERRS